MEGPGPKGPEQSTTNPSGTVTRRSCTIFPEFPQPLTRGTDHRAGGKARSTCATVAAAAPVQLSRLAALSRIVEGISGAIRSKGTDDDGSAATAVPRGEAEPRPRKPPDPPPAMAVLGVTGRKYDADKLKIKEKK